MLKRAIHFLRNYGWRQSVLLALDRYFPVNPLARRKVSVGSCTDILFSVADSMRDAVDPVSQAMVDAQGEWMICGDGEGVKFLPGALQSIAVFLQKHPECAVCYFDSAQTAADGSICHYEFRPEFSLEYLRSFDYSGKVIAVRREFAGKNPGASALEILLDAYEHGAEIRRLPQILYTRSGEVKADFSVEAEIVARHLTRCGGGAVTLCENGTRKIERTLCGDPKVSILIPSHDNMAVLKRCVDSIVQIVEYDNFEIVIVENGSTQKELFDYYRMLAEDERIKVVIYPEKEAFNYSRVNNFGVTHCSGEYILFLNNDTEVITPDFIGRMLEFAQLPDVGVTGAKLCYFNGTLQHAGVIIGMGSIAAHHSVGTGAKESGYLNTLCCSREFSAVTFACAMVRKSDFQRVGGLDEVLGIAYNDIDFCLRMRAEGKRVIFTPHAELFHHESLSRGLDDSPEKVARIAREAAFFEARHAEILADGDPYFNPGLSLNSTAFIPRGRLGRLKLLQRRNKS